MEDHHTDVQALLRDIDGAHGYDGQEQHFVPFSRPRSNSHINRTSSYNPCRPEPTACQRTNEYESYDGIGLDGYGMFSNNTDCRVKRKQIDPHWLSQTFTPSHNMKMEEAQGQQVESRYQVIHRHHTPLVHFSGRSNLSVDNGVMVSYRWRLRDLCRSRL